MSKAIENNKLAISQKWTKVWIWIELLCLIFAVSIETSWFSYFKQFKSLVLVFWPQNFVSIRLLESFTWKISRMAWSFDFIFCTAIGIPCGCPLKSSLLFFKIPIDINIYFHLENGSMEEVNNIRVSDLFFVILHHPSKVYWMK